LYFDKLQQRACKITLTSKNISSEIVSSLSAVQTAVELEFIRESVDIIVIMTAKLLLLSSQNSMERNIFH